MLANRPGRRCRDGRWGRKRGHRQEPSGGSLPGAWWRVRAVAAVRLRGARHDVGHRRPPTPCDRHGGLLGPPPLHRRAIPDRIQLAGRRPRFDRGPVQHVGHVPKQSRGAADVLDVFLLHLRLQQLRGARDLPARLGVARHLGQLPSHHGLGRGSVHFLLHQQGLWRGVALAGQLYPGGRPRCAFVRNRRVQRHDQALRFRVPGGRAGGVAYQEPLACAYPEKHGVSGADEVASPHQANPSRQRRSRHA
mmetsp:Transcript_24712/g.66628  ORF Transcript_24712/g.66628 Transcript_24712/m.66628 type:complete len:249 (-) Transcript_24712:336-1082(-)